VLSLSDRLKPWDVIAARLSAAAAADLVLAVTTRRRRADLAGRRDAGLLLETVIRARRWSIGRDVSGPRESV